MICSSRDVLGNNRTIKEACACKVGQGCAWRNRWSARQRVRQRSRTGNDRQYYTRYQYDKTGNLNQHTDAKGQAEQYEHDRLGRLVKIVDAEQGETLLTYDARDNLLSVTDPEGRVTRYRYNRNDQRTAEIKPAAEPVSERRYAYDANGNLVEEITPAGEVKRYEYDRANRMVGMALFASEQAQQPVKRVSYLVSGRNQYQGYQQVVGEDAANRTADIQALSESYVYNNLGQVTSVTVNFGPFSKIYGYTYYPNGLKKTYTTPEGVTYTYYYNKNNQFTAVHIPGSGQLSRGNFYWLQPQTLLLPGGSQVTLSYDDFLQVKERILQDPEQENVAQALYDYDAVGDITAIDTEHGQYSFDYDRLYRLTDVIYPETTAANDETFDYDGVGNRTGHTQVPKEGEAEEIAATYNSLNQLVSQTKDGVETTFTYNTNGHTATKTTGSETTEYIYNLEERLIAVKKNGITVGEYAYNPLGQRIKKTVNGQTTWYLYNDEGLAAEYNQQGQLIVEYHFTPYSTWMTDPLFQRRGGQVYYYQNNHLGTPQRMVSAAGDVVWEARYTAFGQAEIITEVVANNLRFPGQYFDGESGLHHNYFRDYNPGVGRYVQGDPIGLWGGVNEYLYVNANPYRFFDPLGLFAKCERTRIWGEGRTRTSDYKKWNHSFSYPSLGFGEPSLGAGVSVDYSRRSVRPSLSVSADMYYAVVSVGRWETYEKVRKEKVYSVACTFTVIDECGNEKEKTTFSRDSEWEVVSDVLKDKGSLTFQIIEYFLLGEVGL